MSFGQSAGEAAAEGAESLLPVFVFDPSRFNVPTLAGKLSPCRR